MSTSEERNKADAARVREANEKAAREHERERKRRTSARQAVKVAKAKAKDTRKEIRELKDEIKEFDTTTAGGNLVELRDENAALTSEREELRKALAERKRLAGVA